MAKRNLNVARAGGTLALIVAMIASALSLRERPARTAADAGRAPAAPSEREGEVASALALPLAFEENAGRVDERARFVSRIAGGTVFLTDSGAVLSVQSPGGLTASFDFALTGSNPEARPVGERALPAKVSWLVGNDPSRWRRGIRAFAAVRYPGVYPGIDVVYRHAGRDLEYDLEVAPGANPSIVRMEFPGADGVRLDSGDVVLSVSGHEVRQHRPRAFQGEGSGRREIGVSYVLSGGAVALRLDPYDRRRALVIDPVIYSTYLGGTGNDSIAGVAVDSGGNAYIVGYTYSSGFPKGGAAPTRPMFVGKLDPTGQSFVYLTYVGSTGGDRPKAIALDDQANVYIAGDTTQTDFPTTTGAYQMGKSAGTSADVFVAKLDAAGSVLYATYLGGGTDDLARGLAVDLSGNACVTGSTVFNSFPQVNPLPFSTNYGNGFVTKVAADGRSLIFSTLLGGSGTDEGTSVAVDAQSNVHVVGYTESGNFPVTTGALQSLLSGVRDAFVTKIRADGQVLLYSTYLGGSGGVDRANGVAVDSSGRAVVVGETDSTDFPTLDAVQGALNGTARDFFVTKLDAAGSLVFSTYHGGTGADTGTAVALDRWDNVHVAGYTYGSRTGNGTTDGMLASFGAAGRPRLLSWLLGGAENEYVNGLATSQEGDLYVAGSTASPSDFQPAPTAAMQGTFGGQTDGFLMRVALAPLVASASPNFGPTAGGTAVTLVGLGFQTGATVTFGGTAATDVVVVDQGTITVTSPAHAQGFVDIVVTNPDASSGTLPIGFSYTDAPAPVVSGVSPSSGPTSGGTAVTISGTGFASFASVYFGGVQTYSFVSESPTSITVVTPAHAAGAVDVTVTNLDRQSGTLAGAFTYTAPPTVASVSPSSGPVAGGTQVTVDGTGFASGATVTFGGTQATGVVVQSATRISATTPAHAAGAVTVLVTNADGGVGSRANAFTFVAAPTVASISPTSGSSGGGTSVSISGTGFRTGANVSFGGVPATGVNVSSSSLVTATTPANAAGTVEVVVANDDGQSATLASAFTFVAPPVPSGVVPATGTDAGGTVVAISGTGFQAGATVTFGGIPAADVTVDSDALIHATTPAHAAGAVDVAVTNPDGLSTVLLQGFAYEAPPPSPDDVKASGCGCGTGGADLALLAALGAALALRPRGLRTRKSP